MSGLNAARQEFPTVPWAWLARICAIVVLAGAASISLVTGMRGRPVSEPSGVPAAAWRPISEALGLDAAAYQVRALAAQNRAAGLTMRFGHRGVNVNGMLLGLASVGRGAAATQQGSTTPHTKANRVEYSLRGITQSFINGPLGLEQTFELAQRPTGSGPVELTLRTAGALRTHVGGGAATITLANAHKLTLSGLGVRDANGAGVPARFELRHGQLRIRVDDESARYPLRIDPFVQQGSKLVGTPSGPDAFQGDSVAVSSDGNTILVGGQNDAAGDGGAWVFVRTGTTWSQQAHLVGDCTVSCSNEGTGEVGQGAFGTSVALSGDGDTAVIGAPGDSSNNGAVWTFKRSGANWTGDGPKLTGNCTSSCGAQGTGENGAAQFGQSVSLSRDGTTLLVGGPQDGGDVSFTGQGAAWVFTRNGVGWDQQARLVGDCQGTKCDNEGTGEYSNGTGAFGTAGALSSDGSTAVIGAPYDGSPSFTGGFWIFTRSGTSWSQQTHVNGPDESTAALSIETEFGIRVALSDDGNTALIGAPYDMDGGSTFKGSAYVYTRAGSTWSLQHQLIGSGAEDDTIQNEPPIEGSSVALSADGNTALFGGAFDHGAGAAWIFTRSGTGWAQQGPKLVGDCTSDCRYQGTGEQHFGNFGGAVATAADAHTLVIGALRDTLDLANGFARGATFVFGYVPQPSIFPMTIDATHVASTQFRLLGSSPVSDSGLRSTAAPQTLNLAPGTYRFMLGPRLSISCSLSISPSGAWSYAPACASYISGGGTDTLHVKGFPIRLDALGLSTDIAVNDVYGITGSYLRARRTLVLPPVGTGGAYTVSVGPTQHSSCAFTLSAAGQVQIAPAMHGCVTTTPAHNTASFVGFPIRITTRSLSTSKFLLPGTSLLGSTPQRSDLPSGRLYHLLPLAFGSSYRFSTGRTPSPLTWVVDGSGHLQFGARFDRWVSGRGTSMLKITGYALTLDARRLGPGTFSIPSAFFSHRFTDAVTHALRLVPNTYQARTSHASYRWTVKTDGTLALPRRHTCEALHGRTIALGCLRLRH
jgi:hypothetical protein